MNCENWTSSVQFSWYLLGLSTRAELERHPKIGASWEGFIIENLIQALGLDARQCYYWATQARIP